MRLWRKRTHAGFLPVFVASIVATFWTSVLKMLIVIVAPVLALMWFGQPALLLQYWTHGPSVNPVYDECTYLALDGMHVIIPGLHGNPNICPSILFVPADIGKLIWG